MEHSGWVLKSLTVRALSKRRANGKKWDIDNSWPDLFVQAYQGGRLVGETTSSLDCEQASWEPLFHFVNDSPAHLTILDRDLNWHNSGGEFRMRITSGQAPRTTYENDELEAELLWAEGHY